MINRKEVNVKLEDLDYIKSIEAVNKYMNFGVSGYEDTEEKIAHHKILEDKFIESQNKIEDDFNFIEYVADNQHPNRKRGVLFEKKTMIKVSRTKTKKKSKKFLFPYWIFLFKNQSQLIC